MLEHVVWHGATVRPDWRPDWIRKLRKQSCQTAATETSASEEPVAAVDFRLDQAQSLSVVSC